MDSTKETSVEAPRTSEEERWALLADALPEKRRDYYLDQFRHINGGKALGLSWNSAAFLFTFSWLSYRRMRGYASAYFFVSTPVLLFLLVLTTADPCFSEVIRTVIPKVLLALLVAGYLLPPLFANRLYLRFVRKQIALAQHLESGTEARERRIRSRLGKGADWGSWVLMSGIVVIILWAVGSMGYKMRSAVNSLISAAAGYVHVATEFYADKGRFPLNIEEIGGHGRPYRCVKEIIMEKDGSIRVIAGFEPLDGQSIIFTPTARGHEVFWTCTGGDIPAKHRPANCR